MRIPHRQPTSAEATRTHPGECWLWLAIGAGSSGGPAAGKGKASKFTTALGAPGGAQLKVMVTAIAAVAVTNAILALPPRRQCRFAA